MNHLPGGSPHRLTGGLLLIALWLTACASPMPDFSRIATPTAGSVHSSPLATSDPALASPSATLDVTAVPVTQLLQAAPLGDEPARPIYTLVAEPKEWDNLSGQIPDAALEAGREAGVPVIVAFAGVKGSSGYQVSVSRALLQADRLIITVEVAAPGADDIVEPATTLPFALATLPADALTAARSYTIVDDSGVELSRGQLNSLQK